MHQHSPKIKLQFKQLSSREFEGHGSIFGNKDWGGDVVLPGAFKRTLAEHKSEGTLPSMFWMHDAGRVPGKWTEMREDGKGLYVRGVLAETDLGNEIHTLLKMDAVSGMSIGYLTREADYEQDGTRLIKDVDLLEVSVVSLPMNPKAQITMVKSRLSARGEYVPSDQEVVELKREMEYFLITKGWSKRAATAGVSSLFTGLTGAIPEDPAEITSATPESLEVEAGLSAFHEKSLLYDLENQFKHIFS